MNANDALSPWFYRGGRPNRAAAALNRIWATLSSAGLWPSRLARLEVRGRRSGRLLSFPVVLADRDGERYLVATLGEGTNWVANVRAAGGQAVLSHGTREAVRLEEVPAPERAPILRRYLQVAPGGRPHIPVDRRASLAEFAEVASRYPVFRIRAGAGPSESGQPPQSDDRRLLRIGGVAALILGAAYLVTIALYASVGSPPSTGQAWLEYLSGKTGVWSAIAALSVLTDLLYVPLALALYRLLSGVGRNVMLLATAFVGLFVVLDLAVTWSNYGLLITLSGQYAAATSDAQRAAYVAAANYPASVLSSALEPVYAITTLSLAILLIGVVMLRGGFGRLAAALGVVTGALGLNAMSRVGAVIILNAVFAIAWVLLVGYRLYRLGSPGADPSS